MALRLREENATQAWHLKGAEAVMKSYKEVIKERYDKSRYDGKAIKGDIYAPINPVGFYGEFKMAQILSRFVSTISSHGRRLDQIKICDCGCGDGGKTRLLAELLGNPDQVYGIEYSKTRLEHCKNMNGFIHYEYADLTKQGGGIPFSVQFDGIIACVVFMHFSRRTEIAEALKNIYGALKNRGFFLWYDCNAKSHWDVRNKNADGWGYSANEMDRFAIDAGFKLFEQTGIYPRFPFINKTTIYMIKNIENIWAWELLEKLPFKKNNNVRIYYKE